ncbi:hypothetical protein [Haloferula sp. A504]|uniref:hypothetical protein n=1 Tax=Haloferula sp. A504 TaxID=3373601 RepID=UPI0037C04847
MVLLSMLAIGLLSLSTVTLRASASGSAMAEARANARLALVMAIGQLQKAAGPDTRITADADLLAEDTPNAHWTGVWKTRPDEDLGTGEPGLSVVDHHDSDLYLTDSRVGESGRVVERPGVLEWLVSGNAAPDTTPEDSWIPLVAAEDESDRVSVPPVKLGENDRLGWWVSDENQKALVSLPDRNAGTNPVASRVASQDFDFETFAPGGGSALLAGHADLPDSQLESVVSLATAALLPLAGGDQIQGELSGLGHHLTSHARGLFVDVKRSGLKQDLSTFLALGDIPASADLAGLREDDVILPGEHHRMTSPRFGILKAWADLANELDRDAGPAVIEPRPPVTKRMDIPGSVSGPVRDLVNATEPAIQPVVIEASLGWDFSPYSVNGAPTDYMRGHIYPRLILWNPFNVTLAAKEYVVLLSHPLYGGFSARGTRIDSRGNRFYFDDMCGRPTEGFLGFVTEPTELAPGETKVFTPSVEASAGTKLFGKAVAFDPQDYSSNVLTAEQIPGVENFYWDSTVPVPPETPSNRNQPYGFSADMNSFYATPGFSDEFIVYQVDGNPGSISYQDLDSDSGFPRVGHFLCQNWGLNRYHKWYGAEKNNHPSNNGTPFREFRPGAQDIGVLDNRRPPRLWRRGVRMIWFDDESEHVATGKQVPAGRYTVPWMASANLRGGLLHHGNWVNIPFASGWQFPGSDSHIYFRQPTDPQLFQNFFPPSPFGAPDDSLPARCTIYDVPRRETGVISMGQLQHAQLSYCTWHPSLVIGHSQATMNSDLDATAIKDRIADGSRWEGDRPWVFNNLIQSGTGAESHNGEVLIYDLSFEANEALWDRFMLSSIPFDGSRSDWDGEEPLPVGRYVFNDDASAWNVDRLRQMLASDSSMAFHRAAEFLANDGAFNVNSTSVAAWTALLGSMRDLEVPTLDGNVSSGTHQLSRSVLPAMAGSDLIRSVREEELWNGFRTLSDSDLERLADAIVDQVRERGPFLSVADFVNRRLVEDRSTSGSGAIDQAIVSARVFNRSLDRAARTDTRDIGQVVTAGDRPDSVLYGLPGYFTQGDVLTAIAPAITVRGDTFRIRTYGEARNPDGTVAKAWCEAVVRRTPDYVDPADDATEAAIDHSQENPRIGDLSQANLRFGRRFSMVSFRWLSPEEMSNS